MAESKLIIYHAFGADSAVGVVGGIGGIGGSSAGSAEGIRSAVDTGDVLLVAAAAVDIERGVRGRLPAIGRIRIEARRLGKAAVEDPPVTRDYPAAVPGSAP